MGKESAKIFQLTGLESHWGVWITQAMIRMRRLFRLTDLERHRDVACGVGLYDVHIENGERIDGAEDDGVRPERRKTDDPAIAAVGRNEALVPTLVLLVATTHALVVVHFVATDGRILPCCRHVPDSDSDADRYTHPAGFGGRRGFVTRAFYGWSFHGALEGHGGAIRGYLARRTESGGAAVGPAVPRPTADSSQHLSYARKPVSGRDLAILHAPLQTRRAHV